MTQTPKPKKIEVVEVWRGQSRGQLNIRTNIPILGMKTCKMLDYSKMRTLKQANWTWEQLRDEFSLDSVEQVIEVVRAAKEPVTEFLKAEAEKERKRRRAEAKKRAQEEAYEQEQFEKRRVRYAKKHNV